MGRHSKESAGRRYRGRHRAPTTTGKTVARIATAGAIASIAPMTMGAGTAQAASGGMDHDAIIACESGGDARAQNSSSSASGLYQFIDSTWKAYGGSTARAKDASVSEQRRVAERAFAAEGYSPWNASRSCWKGKVGSGSSVTIRNGESKQRASKSEKSTVKKSTSKKVAPKVEKRVAPKSVSKSATKSHARTSTSSTYTVRSGDTLSGIALTHGTSWRELHAKNRDVIGNNPNLILPGQTLEVR